MAKTCRDGIAHQHVKNPQLKMMMKSAGVIQIKTLENDNFWEKSDLSAKEKMWNLTNVTAI